MQRSVRTADGRNLAVEESGDPQGRPVMVHMGTPNSRHLHRATIADAQARGLRLISYDRPGYGESDPHPGRNIADCASDARAICEHLGIGRLGMWGISGGGPHVLACAALLPDLVAAAASLASPAPYSAEGLDWFADMGQDNVDDFQLLSSDKAAARVKLEQDRHTILAVTASDLTAAMQSLLTPVDAAALTGAMAEYLVYTNQEGLGPSVEGWWDDGCAEVAAWGFDLASITVPVLLLHGRQDKFVPFQHGQWLAAHVPGVEARMLDDDGHITLLENRVGEVHDWLDRHA